MQTRSEIAVKTRALWSKPDDRDFIGGFADYINKIVFVGRLLRASRYTRNQIEPDCDQCQSRPPESGDAEPVYASEIPHVIRGFSVDLLGRSPASQSPASAAARAVVFFVDSLIHSLSFAMSLPTVLEPANKTPASRIPNTGIKYMALCKPSARNGSNVLCVNSVTPAAAAARLV